MSDLSTSAGREEARFLSQSTSSSGSGSAVAPQACSGGGFVFPESWLAFTLCGRLSHSSWNHAMEAHVRLENCFSPAEKVQYDSGTRLELQAHQRQNERDNISPYLPYKHITVAWNLQNNWSVYYTWMDVCEYRHIPVYSNDWFNVRVKNTYNCAATYWKRQQNKFWFLICQNVRLYFLKQCRVTETWANIPHEQKRIVYHHWFMEGVSSISALDIWICFRRLCFILLYI